jgi:hypothetical protein
MVAWRITRNYRMAASCMIIVDNLMQRSLFRRCTLSSKKSTIRNDGSNISLQKMSVAISRLSASQQSREDRSILQFRFCSYYSHVFNYKLIFNYQLIVGVAIDTYKLARRAAYKDRQIQNSHLLTCDQLDRWSNVHSSTYRDSSQVVANIYSIRGQSNSS